MLFQCKVDRKFSDLKIGDFFLFKYEAYANYIFRYTPVLKKVSETSYEWAGGHLFNDHRKKYKEPNIKGTSYGPASVYKCMWQANTLEWSVHF